MTNHLTDHPIMQNITKAYMAHIYDFMVKDYQEQFWSRIQYYDILNTYYFIEKLMI